MIALAIGRVVWIRGLTFKAFDTPAAAASYAARLNGAK